MDKQKESFKTYPRPSSVEGNAAIILDDGRASGYTMVAALKSNGQRDAAKVVAAAPVASSTAPELVATVADAVVSRLPPVATPLPSPGSPGSGTF